MKPQIDNYAVHTSVDFSDTACCRLSIYDFRSISRLPNCRVLNKSTMDSIKSRNNRLQEVQRLTSTLATLRSPQPSESFRVHLSQAADALVGAAAAGIADVLPACYCSARNSCPCNHTYPILKPCIKKMNECQPVRLVLSICACF